MNMHWLHVAVINSTKYDKFHSPKLPILEMKKNIIFAPKCTISITTICFILIYNIFAILSFPHNIYLYIYGLKYYFDSSILYLKLIYG